MTPDSDLYKERVLLDAYPELDKLAHSAFTQSVESRVSDKQRIERLLVYMGRLTDMKNARKVLVLGCGPYPEPAQLLVEHGHDVVCVEPVLSFVETAREYLGESATVMQGAAENIPVADQSQDIVLFESVLEHVDSVPISLEEINRVLAPGGILYVSTTNRHRFSPTGENGEYTFPFFNWLPASVRECFVHEHLHYRPKLANYSLRPAVHWFTFSELCNRGRDAGFARFYSYVDLMRESDSSIQSSTFRKAILRRIQRSPWLRALALSQISGHVFMWKRAGF